MTDVSELLPCPFCGGKAERHTIGDDEPNNAGGDCIVCTKCAASSHVEFGRKENLVSRWNARAAIEASGVQSLSERVAVLEGALEPFAKAADVKLCGEWGNEEQFGQTDVGFYLTFGDLRHAREALTKEGIENGR